MHQAAAKGSETKQVVISCKVFTCRIQSRAVYVLCRNPGPSGKELIPTQIPLEGGGCMHDIHLSVHSHENWVGGLEPLKTAPIFSLVLFKVPAYSSANNMFKDGRMTAPCLTHHHLLDPPFDRGRYRCNWPTPCPCLLVSIHRASATTVSPAGRAFRLD
ncbi:wiskott-Aldrich syndrome protein family member 2 [Musa troglodytarum]|uniref:Wiskott-Aldrich syndrome protein family member 2 n=1 Tax=Musa troglodytarum TaxID=320322 RepID=A0A9E7KTX4_9LILI|nr:wiskott-Aldrich syndrome protein family member 2 [Musa troglodytarum]